jgi:hypothetical protein
LALLVVVAVFLYRSLRPSTAEELFAEAQQASANHKYNVTLERIDELRTRFPNSPLLADLEPLEEQAHERLPVVEAYKEHGREVTIKELSARGELRRATSNFAAGELELALARCHLILQFYGDLPQYVAGAQKLMQEIERGRKGSAPPAKAPDASTPATSVEGAAP